MDPTSLTLVFLNYWEIVIILTVTTISEVFLLFLLKYFLKQNNLAVRKWLYLQICYMGNSFQTELEISRASYFDGTRRSPIYLVLCDITKSTFFKNVLFTETCMYWECCLEWVHSMHHILFQMQMVSNPQQFDLVVMPNLYGNIITAIGAGLIGGPGVVSGANLGSKFAIFEPVNLLIWSMHTLW